MVVSRRRYASFIYGRSSSFWSKDQKQN
uniref:Uncharacterized protein n=1 Tax=Arundo donax TaxID=35708 RepID=A0A0A9AUG6_ARUDO